MKIATISLAAVLLLVASGSPVSAANGPSSEAVPDTMQSSIDSSQRAETLSRIAAGIAAGSAAMQAFHGVPSANAENKDILNPQIPGLDCYIDRILNYVSCFGALNQTEEAAHRLFARFVEELQAVLPVKMAGLGKAAGN